MNDLTVETINKIVELAAPARLEVDGRVYLSKDVRPMKEPTGDTFVVGGLVALVAFLQFDLGESALSNQHVLHVVTERDVQVVGREFGPWKQRRVVARATCEDVTKFPFGQYVSQETAVIALQRSFVQDATTAALLKLIGTISDSKVATSIDDGVTQKVTASAGIARVEVLDVPNPVTLHPYRTFPEVSQPAIEFIVRMKSGAAEEAPGVALFEVENPLWRRVARERIAAYLTAAFPTTVILA